MTQFISRFTPLYRLFNNEHSHFFMKMTVKFEYFKNDLFTTNLLVVIFMPLLRALVVDLLKCRAFMLPSKTARPHSQRGIIEMWTDIQK